MMQHDRDKVWEDAFVQVMQEVLRHLNTETVQEEREEVREGAAAQVMPEVLRHLHRGTDHARRRLLLERLTFLAQQLREHMRRWLPDLIQLTVDFWDASALHITRALLALHSELASARPRLPALLPPCAPA